jgi:hypothetical protein
VNSTLPRNALREIVIVDNLADSQQVRPELSSPNYTINVEPAIEDDGPVVRLRITDSHCVPAVERHRAVSSE